MPEDHKYAKINRELVSGEIEDIIGQPPGWLIRYGVTVFFVIILMFLGGSAVFKYPNKVMAPVVITTQNPPLSLVARVDGKIDAFLVQDTQQVAQGDLLVILESPADYKEIIQLKNLLAALPDSAIPEKVAEGFPDFNHLGQVQPFYADFLQASDDYLHFKKLDFHEKRLKELKIELKKYKVYYNRLYRQRNLAEEELSLIRNQFYRDSVLYSKKVLSKSDYEKSMVVWISKKQVFEQTRVRLSEATIQISKLEQAILDTKMTFSNQQNDKILAMQKNLKKLLSSLDDWRKGHIIMAPVSGKVSFTKYWAPHQYVSRGQPVLSIIPDDPGQWIGRMKIPMRRSGQVKSGLPVNIQLKNYPYLEYGMIRGVVSSVSLVPDGNSYFIDIDLPDGLTTTYGKKLLFKQEMEGTGEILTEKRSLLRRILDPFRYMFKKYIQKT